MQIGDQTQLWLKEQFKIAEQVVIERDEYNVEVKHEKHDNFAVLPSPLQDGHPNFYFGGVDVSFSDDEKSQAVAVYVVLDSRSMEAVYCDNERFHLKVPYIPSFLAFREIDPLQRLILKQLRQNPELKPRAILVDGNGLFHPRRAGIACFLGVKTGVPTIGVGKNLHAIGGLTKDIVSAQTNERLGLIALARVQSPLLLDHKESVLFAKAAIGCDKHKAEGTEDKPTRVELLKSLPASCIGVAIPLKVAVLEERPESLGCLLIGQGGHSAGGRKKANAGSSLPIFVSVGSGISLQLSVRICAALSFFRIPEPIRQADLMGREIMRSWEDRGNS